MCAQLPTGAEPDVLEPPSGVGPVFYAVSVTPKGDNQSWQTGTSGHHAVFTITNTGTCSDNFNVSVSATGPFSGVTVSPASASLGPGGFTYDTITYNVTYSGSGTLTLTVCGNVGTECDDGYYNVSVSSNGPTISLAPHNSDFRDVTKCVATCFDAVAGYATPPYFSWDTPHAVQLMYRSAQAKALGLVELDAQDTSSVNPAKLSIQLRDYSTGGSVTSEVFYRDSTHNVSRLAVQYDASALGTGAYLYLVAVRSYRADNSFRENDVPIQVLVLNEASSPFGAGWSIAGFQHLYSQSGAVAITDGKGSVGYFVGCSSGCTLTSPKGDFTTVWSVGTVGADSAKYYRRYPDGTTFAFRSDGRLWYVQDRFNNQTRFRYNASNLLAAITDPAGMTDSLGYVANKLRWIKDPGGRTDSITIDGSGNLTQVKDWAGGLPFQGFYDANHRLIRSIDRRGGSWGIAYDFAGKVSADTVPQITANGQAVRPVIAYASTEKKILIDPNSLLGTLNNPGANVDTSTVRASVTNARGFMTTYALDRFGAPTLVQEPLGRTTRFTRDSNSAVLRTVLPSGHVLKYSWSGPDLTQQVDSATGRTINYTHEATFHQVTKVSGDVDTVFNFWSGGHLDSTRTGASGETRYFYAANGRMVSDTDPLKHFTTYHYQANGFQNTDTVHFAVGKVAFQYDGHGQRTLTIDQMNDTSRAVYDSIGRVIQTVGALHDTTRSTYDGLYLTQVRDAKGQTYTFAPNALGWADSTTDPTGHVDHFGYDASGNRTTWTNRLGQTIQYTYDSLDQARSVVAGGKTRTYFTDPAGRYQVAVDSESVDTVRVDSAGRPLIAVTCRVVASGSPLACFRDSSTYERHDLRQQLILGAPAQWGTTQFLVGYRYDAFLRLDTLLAGSITGQVAQPIIFSYSGEGLITSRRVAGLNNLAISDDYVWTHVTDQTQLTDSTLNAALGWGYQYDSLGRMNRASHGPFALPDRRRTFAYDGASELTGYEDDQYVYSQQVDSSCSRSLAGDPCPDTSSVQSINEIRSGNYAYDSVGNRKDPAAPGGGLDWGNRLRRWQSYRMDYDAAGNLIAKRTLSASDTTRVLRRDSLFWSALGQLDSVHTRDSLNTLTRRGFGYDALGRRIRKSAPTWTRRYVWDGDALLIELDTIGNGIAAYTYYPGTDNPAAVLRHDLGDSTFYYLADRSGNVTALLKWTGSTIAIVNSYAYDPFGMALSTSEGVPQPLQFAGREDDVETGLYYVRARYYDPAVGRFVSEDPTGLLGGLNLYAYAANDPADGRDPSGHDSCTSNGRAVDCTGSGDREWIHYLWHFNHSLGERQDLSFVFDDILADVTTDCAKVRCPTPYQLLHNKKLVAQLKFILALSLADGRERGGYLLLGPDGSVQLGATGVGTLSNFDMIAILGPMPSEAFAEFHTHPDVAPGIPGAPPFSGDMPSSNVYGIVISRDHIWFLMPWNPPGQEAPWPPTK